MSYAKVSTWPSGNVRYMHVPAGVPIFRDRFFGGGSGDSVTPAAGRPFNYTDDSGLPVKITPLPQNTNSAGGLVNPSQFAYRTYGIRDKGGSVLIN